MTLAQEVFPLVPIGEENAISGRLIWRQMRVWSPVSVKNQLAKLVKEGRVQRKHLFRGKHVTSLYFRLQE